VLNSLWARLRISVPPAPTPSPGHRQSQGRLQGFPQPLERRRPRHPHDGPANRKRTLSC
jgi:hypothetical protein